MQFIEYNQIIDEVKSSNFLVIDKNIYDLYPEIAKVIEGKTYYLLQDPEKNKNIQTYSEIISHFLQNKITRGDTITSIGGGATSDLSGFIAYSILRGVRWKCITTTLLGMIDASIGGKVGINCTEGKNLIGGFHKPIQILSCMDFLKTLRPEDHESGRGELLKYNYLSSAIADESKIPLSKNLITKCAQLKIEIIERDFLENGERKLLNLGHTVGHALEKVSGISHGLCVAIGLEIMIKLYAPELESDYASRAAFFNIGKHDSKFNFDTVWKFIENDKKVTVNQEIDIIIPVGVGESIVKRIFLLEFKKKMLENGCYKTYFE